MKLKVFNLEDRLLVEQFVKVSELSFMDNDFVPKNIKDDQALLKELSYENEFFKHARCQFFILQDETGNNIARVLAFVDKLTNPELGQFGYFICPNNQETARRLLNEASLWLKKQNCKIMQGPTQLNIYNSYRIMTKGHEKDVFLGEPRNPSFYEQLLIGCDLSPDAQWRSFDLNKKQCQILSAGISEAIKMSPESNVKIHEVNLQNLDEELRQLYPHALEIFSENYNYTKITQDEFVSQFLALKNVLAPGSFLIAKDQEQIVGFVYGHLDFAANLKNNDFQSAPRRFVFHTFGVKISHRKTPVAYLLANTIFEKISPYFDTAIGALAKEGKSFYDKIAEPSRVYATFKKTLS